MAREEALNKLCGSPKPPSPKRPPRAYYPPSPSSSSSSSSSSRARLLHETPHPLYHQPVYPSRSYKPNSNVTHHHRYKQQQQHRSSRHKALSSDDEDDDLSLIYTLSPPRSPLHPQSPGRHQFPSSLKKVSARELHPQDEDSDDDGIPLADEMRTMMRVPK